MINLFIALVCWLVGLRPVTTNRLEQTERTIMAKLSDAIARVNAVNTNLSESAARIEAAIAAGANPDLTPEQEGSVVALEANDARVAAIVPKVVVEPPPVEPPPAP